jgi:type IV/VI secretion system ImpK/VasF family protein
MMNKELWSIIVTINASLNPLREAVSLDTIATLDLVKLRSKLRDQLEQLRTAITERYSERDAYLVLFPLTAHCDELVKKMILDINQLEWPPLQQELYQVVDAGDLFYELLDNALAKPDTLPLVYEVYYFCLHDGFCGRYGGNVERLSDQLKKLRPHIILQPIVTITPPTPAPKKWANFRMLNRIYYGGVGLLLLLVYCFLTFLASTWHPTF